MGNKAIFRTLGRLAKWPLVVLVRPFPRLNALVWDAQYRMGIWNYLDKYDTRPDLFPDGARILDLGCGTTANLALIPGRYKHYHGVDISRKAIARAISLARPDTSFEVADILSYQDSRTYTVILLREVLYYFPASEVPALLQRLSGMLEPGGRLLVELYDVTSPSAAKVADAIRCSGLDFTEEDIGVHVFVLRSHAKC